MRLLLRMHFKEEVHLPFDVWKLLGGGHRMEAVAYTCALALAATIGIVQLDSG